MKRNTIQLCGLAALLGVGGFVPGCGSKSGGTRKDGSVGATADMASAGGGTGGAAGADARGTGGTAGASDAPGSGGIAGSSDARGTTETLGTGGMSSDAGLVPDSVVEPSALDAHIDQSTSTDARDAPSTGEAGAAARVKSIVGEMFHSCALLDDGTVKCWGYPSFVGTGGAVGLATSSPPVLVPGITTAVAIAAGREYTCVLLGSGGVQCWGQNTGPEYCSYMCSDLPVTITGMTDAVGIAYSSVPTASYNVCTVQTGGKVQCLGSNHLGQLGNGTTTNSSVPVMVSSITTATALAGSNNHTCALLRGGEVRCWGANTSGQLGDGTTTDSSVPVAVSGITNAIGIAAGGATCAVLKNGTVQCWGGNNYGQLGDGTTTNRPLPVTVADIEQAIAVSAGDTHTCALLEGGAIRCWGGNGEGQLGDGTTQGSYVPVPVSGITDATSVAAMGYHTCAVLSGGTVKCWGENLFGQLADGSTTDSHVPVSAKGL